MADKMSMTERAKRGQAALTAKGTRFRPTTEQAKKMAAGATLSRRAKKLGTTKESYLGLLNLTYDEWMELYLSGVKCPNAHADAGAKKPLLVTPTHEALEAAREEVHPSNVVPRSAVRVDGVPIDQLEGPFARSPSAPPPNDGFVDDDHGGRAAYDDEPESRESQR